MSDHIDVGAIRARLIEELRGRIVADTLSLPLGDTAVLAEIAGVAADEASDAHSVATSVSADTSLAALVMRIANSAASGAQDPVHDLSQAVARVGLRFVGALALGAPAVRLLEQLESDLAPVAAEIRRHSVWVAVTAAVLGEGEGTAPELLTAGLVHNIGLSALLVHDPVGARRVLSLTTTGTAQHDAELRVFGFTHGKVGAEIATAWGYPPKLVHLIDQHDHELPGSPLARLVRRADLLLRECGIGVEPNEPGAYQQLDSGPRWPHERARDLVQQLLIAGTAGATDADLPPETDRDLLRLAHAMAA